MRSNVKLVEIQGYHFPLSVEDFRTLRDCGASVFKLNAAQLAFAKRSILRDVSVTVFPWKEVLSEMMTALSASLPENVSMERNGGVITFAFYEEDAEAVENRAELIRKYFGRYCIRSTTSSRSEGDVFMLRLKMEIDLTLPNAPFFTDGAPVFGKAVFNLSSECAFSCEDTMWINGGPAFSVRFLDKLPGSPELHPVIERSFLLSSLSADDCLRMSQFFMDLSTKVGK